MTARANKLTLATQASLTEDQVAQMSGADLMRRALLQKAGQPASAQFDGARLTQLANGPVDFPRP